MAVRKKGKKVRVYEPSRSGVEVVLCEEKDTLIKREGN